MANDYIEEQVLHAVYKRAGPLMPSGYPLVLINTVNYLPLGPLASGCLAYQSTAFYDGTLTGTDPLTVSDSLFSSMYLTLLQNTVLSDDSSGSGDHSQLCKISKRLTQAKDATLSPSKANGGVCAATTAANSGPMSFVPAFDITWVPDINTDPLIIDIDAWRTGSAEEWQQGKPPTGATGERLLAHLQFSDIRICKVAPKALSDRGGWYDAEIVEGMRTGRLDNVSFLRQEGFPDTTGFRRAAAFVLVGSVQFNIRSGSNFDVHKYLGSMSEFLLNTQMPASRIQISSHLSMPLSPTSILGAEKLMNGNIESHWDSGDLYSQYKAGFVVGVGIDAPFA